MEGDEHGRSSGIRVQRSAPARHSRCPGDQFHRDCRALTSAAEQRRSISCDHRHHPWRAWCRQRSWRASSACASSIRCCIASYEHNKQGELQVLEGALGRCAETRRRRRQGPADRRRPRRHRQDRRAWCATCCRKRTSRPSMPSRWAGRWSIPSSPKCRRTPGSSSPWDTRPVVPAADAPKAAGIGPPPALRGSKRRSNPVSTDTSWIASLRPRNDVEEAADALQNRVTPTGDIIATPQRGTVHRQSRHHPRPLDQNAAEQALVATRPGSLASASFAGWRREVMATRSWTELFFLDEATCLRRRPPPMLLLPPRRRATRFRAAWEEGNAVDA